MSLEQFGAAPGIPAVPGVYCILNLANGKHYIGSSQNLKERKQVHWTSLRAGAHHNQKLQRSWIKHGEENFRFDVLETVELDRLTEREQFFMDETMPFYNILRFARSGRGYRHTQEEKIASSARAKAQWASMSPDERAAYAAMLGKARRGGTLKRETREKMSRARKGVVKNQEWRNNLSKAKGQSYIAISPDGVEIPLVGWFKEVL